MNKWYTQHSPFLDKGKPTFRAPGHLLEKMGNGGGNYSSNIEVRIVHYVNQVLF